MSLRSDPGRLAPELGAGMPPDWVAEITGILISESPFVEAIQKGLS